MRAGGKPSQEWVNQQVIVRFPSRGTARLLARLDGISDWGVTLTPMRFSGEGRVETSVIYPSGFYPWERIGSIRLAQEEERM
jgi:hypothetical protein